MPAIKKINPIFKLFLTVVVRLLQEKREIGKLKFELSDLEERRVLAYYKKRYPDKKGDTLKEYFLGLFERRMTALSTSNTERWGRLLSEMRNSFKRGELQHEDTAPLLFEKGRFGM
jgi:hypothetical protein